MDLFPRGGGREGEGEVAECGAIGIATDVLLARAGT